MKVWIFNHYAQPSNYPGGTRHFDLAKSLKKFGCKVSIFSSSFHYTLLKELLPKFKLFSKKNYEDVDFILLKTVGYKNNGFFRLLNIISYPISLVLYLLFSRFEKPSFIIGSTVHPFAGLIGCLLAKLFRVPHVFEIRDLWPETFIDMNVWYKHSLMSRFFYAIESFTVKNSSAFIVLSPLTIDYLKDRYNVEPSNVLLLPNGVNESFCLGNKTIPSSNLREEVHIKYVGGLDSVHGLDFLLEVAKCLPAHYKVTFVGDGKDKGRLMARANSLSLDNVTFLPPVAKQDVPNVLKDSNLLFLSTADVFYGSENKLYEYMSAGKPIIVASNATHNNPVVVLDCGIVLDRNDSEGSSRKLEAYVAENAKDFNEIGERGYDYVINNRTTSILAEKLFKFLQSIDL